MKTSRCYEVKVVSLREVARERPTVSSAEEAAKYWRFHIAATTHFRPDQEQLAVLSLSARKKIIHHEVVGLGILNEVLFHPREVFRSAIMRGAHSIVLMHNHPSGDPTPSEGDVRSTRDVIRGGQLLQIEVLDHVIMGTAEEGRPRDYVSMRELGYF